MMGVVLVGGLFVGACGSSSLRADGGGGAGGAGGAGGTGTGGGGMGGAAGRQVTYISATVNRQLDLLIMVDDSSSMEPAQSNLANNLPSFMNVLKGLPGGLPDLHIGVVTSDMGAGSGNITGCSMNGDNGVFRYAPTGSCTSTTLNSGATFISDSGGASAQTNFTGSDITAVFQCIVQLGASGCGFEHQLASVARALGADGSPPPAENVGFLRPNAYLAIMLVTNEDDCSAPVTSPLFDGSSNTLASAVGPIGSFRCNEFGHRCSLNGAALAPPLRLSPNPTDLTTTVTYDNCESSESEGMLTPVATFVDQIKSLKADPANQIVVASIQGPATPYVENWRMMSVPDTGPWPAIMHSCDLGTGVGFADPGVRLQQFAQAFGGNGLTYSICSANFGPAFQGIATKLTQVMASPGCLQGVIRNKMPSSGTFMPDCIVTEIVPNGATTTVASCDANGGTAPCWQLATSTTCNGGNVLQLNAGSTPPPSNAVFKVDCAVCTPGVSQPGCP
jgi:hypothetical protein